MIVLSYHQFTEEPSDYLFSRTYRQFAEDLTTKEFDLITIDDGNKSQIKACRLLKLMGIRAKLFIPTSLIGTPGYCTWDELRELSKHHDIENHSHSHENLTELDNDSIYHNIHKASLVIEQEIGRKPTHFVPPFNKSNKHVENIAEKLGLTMIKDRIDVTNQMTRTEIINTLIREYEYKSYLEIGVFNREHNFNLVKCINKVCVDPDPKCKADFVMTSDMFFEKYHSTYDLVFVDGSHISTQVYRDILNALDCLNKGGTIVCHDMNPVSLEAQKVPRIQGEWNGDCWMAWVWLRATRSDLSMKVIDTDYGCGIIQRGKQDLLQIDCNITYENLQLNKEKWLNLKPVSTFP